MVIIHKDDLAKFDNILDIKVGTKYKIKSLNIHGYLGYLLELIIRKSGDLGFFFFPSKSGEFGP